MQREQRRCSSQLESCQLRCYAHTHTNSRYANTSPSTTCLSQGSDRIIPGKGEWGGSCPVRCVLSVSARLCEETAQFKTPLARSWEFSPHHRVFLMDDWSGLFSSFHLHPFSSSANLIISFLLVPFSKSIPSCYSFTLSPLGPLLSIFFPLCPSSHPLYPPLHSVHHPRCPLAVFSFALPLPFATLQIDISSSF